MGDGVVSHLLYILLIVRRDGPVQWIHLAQTPPWLSLGFQGGAEAGGRSRLFEERAGPGCQVNHVNLYFGPV